MTGKKFHKIGRPLESFSVDLQSIRLSFTEQTVSFAMFRLRQPAEGYETAPEFDPWEKKGNLNLLWRFINLQCPHVLMDERSLQLVFEDGTILECINTNNTPELVNIFGGTKDRWEITSYPAHLHLLPDFHP